MTQPARILPFRHAPYVPPPADVEPFDPGDPLEGSGAIAWGFAALCAFLALAAFAWMMQP